MTPLLLGALALALAGPVPRLLARAEWLREVPRAAMTLWQAVALAAVLAALGAGLAIATDSALLAPPGPLHPVIAVGAVALTAVVLARLLWKGHRVGRRTRALRRRHREMVDLLAADDAGVRVLSHPTPMAYCLPGLRASRVVVSEGARSALGRAELEAVLAHERAHLRARHDLVLEAFTVLHEAFPRVVSSRAALREVQLLVEVLADAAARRRVGAVPLARALVALADSHAPTAALGAGGSALVVRVRLLQQPAASRLLAATAAYAGAVAVLAVPTAFVAVPWLTRVAPWVAGA